jgi:hypothetical protein
MSYHNIPVKLLVAMASNWYELKTLVKFVTEAKRINFSIVEQRQQILQKLNNLYTICPFDTDHRFPAGAHYVCDSLGDWSRKFQQLRLALSHKDRDLREKGQNIENKDNSMNDSLVAFHNSLNAILEQCSCQDDVWDLGMLEGYFSMDWR